jgi:carbonic anhydrase
VPDSDVPDPAPDTFVPNADELIANNARYVEEFDDHGLSLRPRRMLAIVACMDSRMDIFEMLGLAHGDAHVIRNAGGVVTEDVIRSLVLSQRLLGTQEVILLHHTDCGLQKVVADDLRDEIEADTGQRPAWEIGGFTDPAESVRESIRLLRADPFVAHKAHIRGFVYHVDDGRLVEAVAE